MFYASPFFLPLNSNFCLSENSTLLSCCAASRLSKGLTALSPKIRQGLEDWSPDLFNLFSYLGNKQRDPSKEEQAECHLTILFDRTLHNGYFAKLPLGSRDKFAKITNITLPLVVLTWLCQLQEYFYKIGDTNEDGDWNTHGKYAPVKARHVTREFPLDNMHMMKANSTAVAKITSVQLSEVQSKMIIMGHQISSCHVLVVRSFFIL